MKNTCQELKTEYEKLKILTSKFTAVYTKLRNTGEGDLTKLKRQKAELTAAYEALESKLVVSPEVAIEVMGEREVIGQEDLKNTWGIELSPEEIPDIPFSIKDLERAKELGQCLILRTDKTAEGNPMSMEAMNYMMVEKLDKEGGGDLLRTANGWEFVVGGYFFSNESPRTGWALVSKEIAPDSLNKNYIEQTDVLIDIIKNNVFEGMEIPEEYSKAIEEFESKKKELTKLMDDDFVEATKQLSKLKITQLTRPTVPEVIYDLSMYYGRNGERLLEETRAWTSSLSKFGNLVYLGGFDGSGVGGGSQEMDTQDPHVGTPLSRRQ